ncbi:MAG: fumarylacetoacetate hydrolase family protein [Pseudomonadales bacterium]|jgi:2-keto-4-pentenoate hydratase/2-oxohepta-3-ene-1,7-dioic acid hydratase in catechol pathway|tara:strand:- start:21016 stop:21954 length:939 start_codon:yes stop_codon:yes gene_type:complete
MYVATVTIDGEAQVSFVLGRQVISLRKSASNYSNTSVSALPGTLLEIIEAGPEAWSMLESYYDSFRDVDLPLEGRDKWWWDASDVKFNPPIKPRKNPWVIGANYMEHLARGFARIPRPAVPPPYVEFFTKRVNSIVGHEDDIVYDKRVTRTVDFELELVVVLGKYGKDIPIEHAYDWVFGYTIANDVSARELQLGHQQYHRGKSLDGFCPMGPVIATPRETGDPNRLKMRQWLNGELKQDWPVGDMIYKIDKLISTLSEGMTVEPGEMIICGTVPGVGFEQLPQAWLQHGDVLEAEISRIGLLRNTIKMAGV